jgi:hypothetical protein
MDCPPAVLLNLVLVNIFSTQVQLYVQLYPSRSNFEYFTRMTFFFIIYWEPALHGVDASFYVPILIPKCKMTPTAAHRPKNVPGTVLNLVLVRAGAAAACMYPVACRMRAARLSQSGYYT